MSFSYKSKTLSNFFVTQLCVPLLRGTVAVDQSREFLRAED
jgi:hypothetical protein